MTLRELSSRHEAILQTVPDIIAQAGFAASVYTWVNRAGKEFFGDDVVGKEAGYVLRGGSKNLYHGSAAI